MPAISQYLRPDTQSKERFGVAYQQELTERKKLYKRMDDYYLGKHYRPYMDKNDYKYWTVLNYYKNAADTIAAFVFSHYPTIVVDSENVEKQLNQFVKSLGLEFYKNIVIQSFLHGHAFIYCGNVASIPDIFIIPPENVVVYWNTITRKPIWYELKLYYDNTIHLFDFIDMGEDMWRIIEYRAPYTQVHPDIYGAIELQTDAGYTLANEELKLGAPIFTLNYNPNPFDFYGLVDLPNTYLQDSINRIVSQINAIAAELGEPVDVVTGADIADIDETKQGVVTIANPQAKVTRLQLQTDLNLNMKLLDRLIEEFLLTTRVTILKGSIQEFQRVTNINVMMAMLNMIAKSKYLQDKFSKFIEHLCRLYIASNGLKFSKNNDIQIHYPELIPSDPLAIANVVTMMLANKVWSRQTAYEKMGGLDWEEESKRIDTDMEEAVENNPITSPSQNLTNPNNPVE